MISMGILFTVKVRFKVGFFSFLNLEIKALELGKLANLDSVMIQKARPLPV